MSIIPVVNLDHIIIIISKFSILAARFYRENTFPLVLKSCRCHCYYYCVNAAKVVVEIVKVVPVVTSLLVVEMAAERS